MKQEMVSGPLQKCDYQYSLAQLQRATDHFLFHSPAEAGFYSISDCLQTEDCLPAESAKLLREKLMIAFLYYVFSFY